MIPRLPRLAEVAKIGPRPRAHAALRAGRRAGDFLRRSTSPLRYSARRLGGSLSARSKIDEDAMAWGYSWRSSSSGTRSEVPWGVEQLEDVGSRSAPAARPRPGPGRRRAWYGGRPSAPTVFVGAEGSRAIEAPAGVILLDARVDAAGVIHENKTARLVDLDDGIACLEFRSPKMNILDDGVLALLREAPQILAKVGGFRGLVIGDQTANFCAGADLKRILRWAQERDFAALDQAVSVLQDTLMELRHGWLPVVAAPHGMTMGGGVEVCLHAARIQADAELYMGLVEAGVGLLPAGGGLKELARRASAWASQVDGADPYLGIRRAFDAVGGAKVSTSAAHARAMGFLGPEDRITFHRSRVIADAKRAAIALAEAGWVPPDRDEPIAVIGAPHGASLMLGAQLFEWGGFISPHDKLIGQKIAHVLSGGMRSTAGTLRAQDLLDLEREAFCSLAGEEKTQARIESMLKTKRPLRN
ncbi:MAG: enoyl-CoA hydratase/isomerase family protein [Nannocystaceae bacterium]